jgi:hypothetical protein
MRAVETQILFPWSELDFLGPQSGAINLMTVVM